MTIAVQFPDGSIRNVPAQLREVGDPHRADALPTFERVPLNCDSRWAYHRRGNRWFARPRNGSLTALRPATAEWWRAVPQMDDDAPTDGSGQQQSQRLGSAA